MATALAPEGDLQDIALRLQVFSDWSRFDVLPPWITVDLLDSWGDEPVPFYPLVSGGTFLYVHLRPDDDTRGYYSPHPVPDLELRLTNAGGHVELTEGHVTAARSDRLVVDLEPVVQTAPTRGSLDCQVIFWGEGARRVSRCHRDTIGVYRSAGPGLDLFAAAPRGQPSTGRIQRGGDVLVADVDGQPRFVDLEGMQAHPVLMPSCTRIVAVSTIGEDRALLCEWEEGRALLVEEAGRWQLEPIPEELRLGEEVLVMASQGQDLAIWTRGREDPRWTSRVFWRQEGSWKTVALDDVDALPNRMGTPAHVLLDDGRLWLGFNRGEFGGGLFELRLEDGSWREMGPDTRHLPVTGMLRAADGDIWVTQGMAHMDLREGRLLRFDGQRREEVVTSSPFDERWGLPEADFFGLSMDADGHPMLASGELGILTSPPPEDLEPSRRRT